MNGRKGNGVFSEGKQCLVEGKTVFCGWHIISLYSSEAKDEKNKVSIFCTSFCLHYLCVSYEHVSWNKKILTYATSSP